MNLKEFKSDLSTAKSKDKVSFDKIGGNDDVDYGNLLNAIFFFFNCTRGKENGVCQPFDPSAENSKISLTNIGFTSDKKHATINVTSNNPKLLNQFFDFFKTTYPNESKVENNNKLYFKTTGGNVTADSDDLTKKIKGDIMSKVTPFFSQALTKIPTMTESKKTERIIEEINRINKLIKND